MLNFRNDVAAFKAFISEHQDKVYNLVLNRVQHVQDAEEITQDVFIAVYNKPDAFRGESSITTWLFRIAINKCIDHNRKLRSRGRWKLTRLFGHGEEMPGPADVQHPGVINENKEKIDYLFRALKQLPEKQATAWTLSELDNMSYKEISEIMKTSVASIESLMFRARQNLRSILSELYPGDK